MTTAIIAVRNQRETDYLVPRALAEPEMAGGPRPVRITAAHDGDTFTPLPAFGSGPDIRLACADTPEMEASRWPRQPHAQQARANGLGLWGDPDVVRPSDWRKGKRE